MIGSLEDMVERTAAIVYAGSFTARESREDWERINERANEGGGYAGYIVERCYSVAQDIVEALLNG